MLMAKNQNAQKNLMNLPALTIGGFFNAQGVTRVLFNNKKKNIDELPPLFSEAEINGASYEQVLDFLIAVNDDDFSKIIKVAEIHRQAHRDVAEATGLEYEAPASIFERQEVPEVQLPDTDAGNFLDDDDDADIAAAFLDDEPTGIATDITKPTVKTKAAKNEQANLQS